LFLLFFQLQLVTEGGRGLRRRWLVLVLVLGKTQRRECVCVCVRVCVSEWYNKSNESVDLVGQDIVLSLGKDQEGELMSGSRGTLLYFYFPMILAHFQWAHGAPQHTRSTSSRTCEQQEKERPAASFWVDLSDLPARCKGLGVSEHEIGEGNSTRHRRHCVTSKQPKAWNFEKT
jgi:hypothetical protein